MWFNFKYYPVICPYRCLKHETCHFILCGPTQWSFSSTESGLPHNKVILLLIYLFVTYFISVTSKNFKVGIIKLPVRPLLLQPYKFSNSLCSGWYINKDNIFHFHQRQEKCFLNSKMPDDAAFSFSMPRGVYVCCDVQYGFMVLRFRNGIVRESCELLLTPVTMQVTNTPNVGGLIYWILYFPHSEFQFHGEHCMGKVNVVK